MDMESFRSGGELPSGPVSAWPRERHDELMRAVKEQVHKKNAPQIKAGAMRMAGNLLRTAGQAVANGKVSAEIREERMATCQACPLYNAESKRCSDCGCFMEAKSWVGGDPKQLCPQSKWVR